MNCLFHWRKMLLVALFGIALSANTASAQIDPNICDCEFPGIIKANLPICLGGVNYLVDVYGCEQNPGTLFPEICLNSGLQNRRTTITKICFVGTPPASYSAQALIDAVVCTMNPCRPPYSWGVTMPPVPGTIYCWTIVTPTCVRILANGCLERCGTGCCILAIQFKVDANPINPCIVTYWACNVPGVCYDGCIPLTCMTEQPVCCGP